MTTAAAEAIHNARLNERLRIAELAEERAGELSARGQYLKARPDFWAVMKQAEVLRAFAAELREMS